MSKFQAYAATKEKAPLEPYAYEPAKLDPFDAEVKISHCGVCHSDVHLVDNDWSMSTYPLVPGHEIVGTVEDLGSEATHLNKGDRVGIGWMRGSCQECEYCIRGEDQLCAAQQATCMGNFGGFADRIRVDSRFAFKIPEKLDSENAAPLLCGGITVYAPLVTHEIRPESRVAVIGIGGLGHLALQFASAFGCEVTALSSSPDKEAEAKSFGAQNFIVNSDPAQMEKAQGQFDFILNTVHHDLDWKNYLSCLRPNGKLCFVGVPDKPLEIPVFLLLFGQKTICGSTIGGRKLIPQMLEFAARHDIQAKTQLLPMSECNPAMDLVRQNKARYRMVLRA